MAAFFIYSFQNSSYEETGFITCDSDNVVCEESKHIHAELTLNSCGADIVFPKEKGRTDLQHTHKERNLLHWHARIRIDPTTHEYVDTTPRKLAAFFDQMEFEFPRSCNNNSETEITVSVNDMPQPLGLDYIWQDGDKIDIVVQ